MANSQTFEVIREHNEKLARLGSLASEIELANSNKQQEI